MTLPERARALLRREPGDLHIALVGASRAPHKFGSRILRDLLRKGYVVTPVHPREPEIDGLACVERVSQVVGADIVDVVVPPAVARSVVATLPDGPGPLLWFQPGSFDDAVLACAREKAYEVVAGPCLMVEARG